MVVFGVCLKRLIKQAVLLKAFIKFFIALGGSFEGDFQGHNFLKAE